MKFEEAYKLMKDGKKVRRPHFKGYYYIDSETGEAQVHLASGKDISYGKLDLTIKNVVRDDWEEVAEETDEPKEKTESQKDSDANKA